MRSTQQAAGFSIGADNGCDDLQAQTVPSTLFRGPLLKGRPDAGPVHVKATIVFI